MDHHDEAMQLLKDNRDAWMRRALEAEAELRRWHGYVNALRPDLKPSILARLGQIFHLVRGKRP